MQTEEIALVKSVDYDELTLNAANQDVENDGEADVKKDKTRRYWTPKEEDRFFAIWGRDNWRLTKHGKNTIYFSQWSKELKDLYNIDVKPEEVQAKVNQTRAKFRQVKKNIEADSSVTKWKKYDIIDKILKNQYRSEEDEPIPKEALENNRDIAPNSLTRQTSTPNSISLNSTQDSTLNLAHAAQTTLTGEPMSIDVDDNISGGLFNDSQIKHNYSAELFSDQYTNDIKQEFEENFQNYPGYNEQNHYANNTSEPELHQLQTPQQLQQQQQQQQTIYGSTTTNAAGSGVASTTLLHPQHHLQQHIEQLRQQNQQAQPAQPPLVHYEPVNNATYTNLSNPNHFTNGSYATTNYNASPPSNLTVPQQASAVPIPPAAQQNVMPVANSMQPPRIATTVPSTTGPSPARKRGRPTLPTSTPTLGTTTNSSTPSVDSLESQYLDQVRKKNIILEEQRDISRKRLEVEERKAKLMAEYFPKLLNLQKEILSTISAEPTNNVDTVLNNT